MIKNIKLFFESRISTNAGLATENLDQKLRIACAALMIEMIHADNIEDETEIKVLEELVKNTYNLSDADAKEIIELAGNSRADATDHFRFTSLINTNYTQDQKIKLVEQLWAIAYADNVIDKHEEHLVRKISDLLHVSHKDFIQAKHRVSG